MTIYYLFILLAVLAAVKAEKREKKSWLYIVVILISLLSGLRSISVGTDTQHYERIFLNILHGGSSSLEPFFVQICKWLLAVFGNTRALFIVFAFLTNGLILFRLWDFRKQGSVALMVFLFVSVYFPQSINILRQYLACAIVFWGTKFLDKGKLYSFILLVVLASSIHTSAVVSVLICIPYIFWDDAIGTSKKVLYSLLVIALLPVGYSLYTFLLGEYGSYMIIGYSEAGIEASGISLLMLYRIAVLALFWIMTVSRYGHIRVDELDLLEQQISSNQFEKISIVYTMGVVASLVGMSYAFAGRIALYFIIFEIPFGAILSRREKKIFFKLFFIILALYYLVVKTSILGENGIKPYSMYLWN